MCCYVDQMISKDWLQSVHQIISTRVSSADVLRVGKSPLILGFELGRIVHVLDYGPFDPRLYHKRCSTWATECLDTCNKDVNPLIADSPYYAISLCHFYSRLYNHVKAALTLLDFFRMWVQMRLSYYKCMWFWPLVIIMSACDSDPRNCSHMVP
jgi:hypothetical protein